MLKTMTVRTTIAAILAGLSMSAHAIADTQRIDIPAGSLLTALETLASQADVDLVYQDAQVRDLQTGGVTGEISPHDAVVKLLQGTPLKVSEDEASGAILITTAVPSDSSLSTTSYLHNGESQGEERGQFWSRLRLAQLDTRSPLQGEGSSENSRSARTEGTSDGSPQSQARIELEEIVVTGTHIRGVNPAGSPILVFSRSDIDKSGATSLTEFMRKIPQNFSLVDQETFLNNGAAIASRNLSLGTAVNLRGIGAGATLTLLDGQRIAPSGQDGSFVDVSMIPLSAIERVEILTDGASAIYGADAVGGVVNFILRRDFRGAETSIRYGDSTRGGGAASTGSQLLGVSWGTGNAMLVYEYLDQDSVDVSQRDFIPDIPALTPGPFMLQPDQRRNSFMAATRQRIGPSADVFGRAFFSERDFVQDTSSVIGFSHTAGQASTTGGMLGGTFDVLPAGWSVTSAADYSETKQQARIVDTPPDRVFDVSERSTSRGADIRLTGPAFFIQGAPVRASLGVSARREEFDRSTLRPGSLQRDISSVYAEVFVPLLPPSRRRGMHSLEMSIAGRVDDYSDLTSSGLKPKVGLTWTPFRGFDVRASWAEAFRAPLLSQMDTTTTSAFSYAVVNLPDPTSSTGFTPTIITTVPGNPSLKPERSTSFTFGLDVTPELLPNMRISMTYYDIEYEGRIRTPPLSGSLFLLYRQEAELAPFINRSPDLAVIESYYAQGVSNPSRIAASDVRAIYDSRFQNIASTRSSGFDVAVSYSIDSALGSFAPYVGANYIQRMTNRSASTTPEVELFDKVFTPARLKARGGVSWARGSLSSTLTVNYVGSYQNNFLTPAAPVEDWTTFDWHLKYEPDEQSHSRALQGLSVALSVQNLTDADPPQVAVPGLIQAFNFGYDATNASAIGRYAALQVVKRW